MSTPRNKFLGLRGGKPLLACALGVCGEMKSEAEHESN
jgi:hypothetical protein